METIFKLASEKKSKLIIRTLQVKEKGCTEAVKKVKENKIRWVNNNYKKRPALGGKKLQYIFYISNLILYLILILCLSPRSLVNRKSSKSGNMALQIKLHYHHHIVNSHIA